MTDFIEGINVSAQISFIKEVDGQKGKFLAGTLMSDGQQVSFTAGKKAEDLIKKLKGNLIKGDQVKIDALVAPIEEENGYLGTRIRFINRIYLVRKGQTTSELVYGKQQFADAF